MTNAKQFLTDRDNADRYGVTRQTIWDWTRKGKFPKPVKLNGSTRWKLSDIEAWEVEQGVSA